MVESVRVVGVFACSAGKLTSETCVAIRANWDYRLLLGVLYRFLNILSQMARRYQINARAAAELQESKPTFGSSCLSTMASTMSQLWCGLPKCLIFTVSTGQSGMNTLC